MSWLLVPLLKNAWRETGSARDAAGDHPLRPSR